MDQNLQSNPNPEIQQNKHQSLQLNRLIKFIENKKSPSLHKLKQILINKQSFIHTKENSYSDRANQNPLNHQETQTVAVNTKNIFVGRNKTQVTSPRIQQAHQQKYYRIFVTKQQILKLHQKDKNQFFASHLSSQQNIKSNLFPPLSNPRIKKPVQFKRYEDEISQSIHGGIRNIKLEDNQTIDPSHQQSHRHKHHKGIQNIHIQRQKYNKSLQKLIEKAFKNRQKQKKTLEIQISDKINNINQILEDDEQNTNESNYAYKGKLMSNPHLKIKKDSRFKYQKKQVSLHKQENPIKYEQKQKQKIINQFQMQYKRRIIHTNRQIQHQSSYCKIKTQISGKASQYQPSKNRKQNKTLKLISQLQSSILAQEANTSKIPSFMEVKKAIESSKRQLSAKINQMSPRNESSKQEAKRKRGCKVKTLQSETLPSLKKKSLLNWEVAGYDWRQSTQDVEQNSQLQAYVEKIVKKSDPINLQQKMSHKMNS